MADKYLLIVEGADDYHVLFHLFQHYDITSKIVLKMNGNVRKEDRSRLQDSDSLNVKVIDGIENLNLPLVSSLLDASDLQVLGIIVDADADTSNRWDSVRGTLMRCGYSNVPDQPSAAGTVIQQDGRPTVGVWLMPNNSDPGMIEDFITFLVRPTDALWPRVIKCVDEIPSEERLFGDKTAKARIHTWLAWQSEPGIPMGVAITKHYVDANCQEAQEFVAWIRNIYDLPT